MTLTARIRPRILSSCLLRPPVSTISSRNKSCRCVVRSNMDFADRGISFGGIPVCPLKFATVFPLT